MIVVAALQGGIPHGHQGGHRRRQAQARGQAPPRLFPATSIPPRIARGTPLLIPHAGGTVAVPMTKVMLRGNGKRFQCDWFLMNGSHDDMRDHDPRRQADARADRRSAFLDLRKIGVMHDRVEDGVRMHALRRRCSRQRFSGRKRRRSSGCRDGAEGRCYGRATCIRERFFTAPCRSHRP